MIYDVLSQIISELNAIWNCVVIFHKKGCHEVGNLTSDQIRDVVEIEDRIKLLVNLFSGVAKNLERTKK